MSPWTTVRVSGAYWVLPVTFALGVWVALSEASGSRTDYPVNNLAAASYQLVLTGPVVAACVALRLPPFLALLDDSRITRSRATVLATVWGWVLVGAPAAGIAAMLSATGTVPRELVAWETIGVAFVAGLASAALGALVGATLPRVLAIPVVAAVTFAWITFPGTRLDVLPRNLNSTFSACCADDQQPAAAMVLGSTVLDVIIVLGCLALVGSGHPRSRFVRGIGLVLIASTAAGLGTLAASAAPGRMNLLAVEARTSAVTCATRTAYRVCVWPENRSRAARSMAVLREADAALVRAGLPRATATSEDPSDSDAIQMTAASRADVADARFSLVTGYVQLASTCEGRRATRESGAVVAVVALATGLTPAELTEKGASVATLASAEHVLRGTPATVAAWFRAQTCGDPGGTP